LSGQLATGDELSGVDYWCRHLREPVRFADGITTLEALGCRLFVEIGPRDTLVGLARQTLRRPDTVTVPSLRKDVQDWRVVLSGLGALYTAGVDVDWRALSDGRTPRAVALPTYPFQRERHWVPLSGRRDRLAPAGASALWGQVVGATRRQADEGPFDLALGTFPEKWKQLAGLSRALMASALASMGLFAEAGETWSVDRVLAERPILPVYSKLLRRWLAALAERGDLRVTGGGDFETIVPLRREDPVALVDRLRPLFADYSALLDYVGRAGSLLPEVLTGRESALETLFPGGDGTVARGLYETSPVARYFNGLLRAAADAAASHAGRAIEFLEIGAGTGGSTASIVETLPADRARYTFTDVSQVFLHNARERFADYPFVRYEILDIERPPSEQGFAAHSYDVVVAANVLHATRDLRVTIDHVRQLLAPGGILLLNETTSHPIWFDVTTGLIEGWQRFEDPLRGDHPLIDAEAWVRLLEEQGFEAALFLPEHGSPADMLGNHVVIARGPGGVSRGARVTVSDGEEQATRIEGSRPVDVAGTVADDSDGREFVRRLAEAPVAGRRELLLEFVWRRLMRVLRLDVSTLPDERQRLMDLGVDSLMAVEFRNLLTRDLALERPLPSTIIFDYPTPAAIVSYLARDVLNIDLDDPAGSQPDVPDGDQVRAAELERLSEDEAEALLRGKLGRMLGSDS
jgi:SAM-dependent methyltransferase